MPDTAIAVAFSKVGVEPPWERVLHIGVEAWGKWPAVNAGGARRDFVIGRLRGEMTWEILSRFAPNTITQMIGWLLVQAEKEIKIQRPVVVGRVAGDRNGGGHYETDAHGTLASANISRDVAQAAGSEAANTLSMPKAPAPLASNLKQLADKQAAANMARVSVQLSLLDTFRIEGTPVGDMTPNQARTWARKNTIPSRFVFLLTENLPPNEPIRKYRNGDDTQALWKQAEKEAADAELRSFRAA